MSSINAYLYETKEHGKTIFIYTKLTTKQWLKLLYPIYKVSSDKLYYCSFVTLGGNYFLQGNYSDIETILESCNSKIKFTKEISKSSNLDKNLILKFDKEIDILQNFKLNKY